MPVVNRHSLYFVVLPDYDYQKQNLEILDMNVSRGTLEQHFISMAGGIEK